MVLLIVINRGLGLGIIKQDERWDNVIIVIYLEIENERVGIKIMIKGGELL